MIKISEKFIITKIIGAEMDLKNRIKIKPEFKLQTALFYIEKFIFVKNQFLIL